MNEPVERTCTELRPGEADGPDRYSKPLSAYRSAQAYVLLGDPGSGKTTAFAAESEELGDEALFITARNFLVHEPVPDEWRERTLFIDGLDEVRAGAQDVRTRFDEIRRRLIRLDKPRFRISCRESDWLGENDQQHLEIVSRDSTVTALRLDALRIRTSNSNEWSHYWNEGKHGKPGQPKTENSCRDALLPALKLLLPALVDAQPERQHVNSTRADIEISAQGFHLPVEVKRNSDRQLWSASHDQLIAKYTVDPETDGYGIYLVFWFGWDNQKARADGVQPKSPKELQDRLEESLTVDEARKISICVVDVTAPNADPVHETIGRHGTG